MTSLKGGVIGVILSALLGCSDRAQQADSNFVPQNTQQTFSSKNSPIVFIDEAHNNFLTTNGRFRPFAQVLESDGYTVRPNQERFSAKSLHRADILVIANALDKNRKDWAPPFSDALTDEEVSIVKIWVQQGGSLFLIADHTPFPKIIENLAGQFGFKFSHGHVNNAMFYAHDKTLGDHIITAKVTQSEPLRYLPTGVTETVKSKIQRNRIERVRTFGGSAFKAPPEATSLLTFGEGAFSIVPDIPFQVNADTPRVSMDGWSQGAVLEIGKGRVAVFAEGMMFSSQLDTESGRTFGLAAKGAEQNEMFLLNLMAWLAGVI
ncbi:DUF4350 domain-containing protein [Pseudoalteromonas sp. MMG005]|uniref:DUF4350 domain-containing protein n=1 Tax=Pseudoalteromonas sp. MMG005 TaxID=2822682 RepID=UPI001B39D774|nr:DUF4350 domain-containing protein [Pseudoalteromonas sp. MMG005]MBQ4845325.1 DUF4350 domain-containing protein [Pseudoalteromonas sp. MMG005]